MKLRAAILLTTEGCLYAVGALAALLLGWHIVALALSVTIGPGAPHLEFPIGGQLRVFAAAAVCLGAALGAAARVRRSCRSRMASSTLVVQLGVMLFAMALSYRFVALVMCLAMLLCRMHLSDRRERLALWFWGIGVLSCLAPVDITLRRSSAISAPGLVLAGECSGSLTAGEANLAGRVVCLPDTPFLYSGPRYVLVW
jgi:hypothetical protein